MVALHLKDHEEFKTAVLTSEDAAFGMSRVYEVFSSESPEKVQVFRDRHEALCFLGAPVDLIE